MKHTLVFLSFFLLSSLSIAQKQPNILFIFADDMAFDAIGYNSDEVKTPNLDRLRDQSTLFTHAFNMGSWSPAVCEASRCMINTGAFVWKAASYTWTIHDKNKAIAIDGQALNIKRKEPGAWWSQYMSQAGYETFFTGKWHVRAKAEAVFDHARNVRPGMPNQTKARYERTFKENEPEQWKPWKTEYEGFWKGGKHWSEIVGDDAIEYIQSSKGSEKPFFIYAAFNAPHDPRQSPKRFVDQYPLDNIQVPASFMPEYPYAKEADSGPDLRDEKLAPYPRTEYAVKVNRQEYYAIITHMDEQIGRILDELERQGLAGNTYIFFTADHGLAVGDHGFMGKQNMYDRSIRVPLLVAGPKVPQQHMVDKMVYLQDIMPTTLEIAGIDKPDHVDFKSLLPLVTSKRNKGSYDAIYGCYLGKQRMIRSDRYKMIIYPLANKVRLFDVKKDPEELNDLAANKKYRKEIHQLFEEFKKLQQETGDPVDMEPYLNNFLSTLDR
ncbi:MAG: sulfatase-like hydrolase/transferase [Bacteroidales bacterium]|nr:sulfatase-like hydrolase/transferase [Bacteroidales bacterium]